MPEPNPTSPQAPSTVPPGLEVELIPPAARENARRADQMQADFIASQKNGTAAFVPPSTTPIVATPPAPATAAPPTTPSTPAPGGEAAPTPAATQEEIDLALAQPAAPGSDLAKWQQAYRSMIGRWKAERERDAATIQQLAALVDQRQPAAPAVTAFRAPEVPADEPLITPEERENFGEELTEVIQRVAMRAAERTSKTVVGELVPQLNSMDQQARMDRQARMEAGIAQAMAPTGLTFEQINTDPHFIGWLQLQDAMSGVRRHDLLRDAWNKQDANRVLAIVAGFLDATAPPPPLPNGGTPPAVNPAAPRVPQIPIAELAAPGRATHPSGPPAPAEAKPTYTRQDIKDFYAAKARNFYSAEDAAKWEAEIFAANREGRIIG